jgi:hypothetical protein
MSDYCESYLITATFYDIDSDEYLYKCSALPYIPNVGDTVKLKEGYYIVDALCHEFVHGYNVNIYVHKI